MVVKIRLSIRCCYSNEHKYVHGVGTLRNKVYSRYVPIGVCLQYAIRVQRSYDVSHSVMVTSGRVYLYIIIYVTRAWVCTEPLERRDPVGPSFAAVATILYYYYNLQKRLRVLPMFTVREGGTLFRLLSSPYIHRA